MGLLHLIHGRPWAVQINLLLPWGEKKFTLGIWFTCWERSCLFLFTEIASAPQRWLMHTLKGLGGTINSLLDTMDPVQNKQRSEKIIPVDSGAKPTLHWVYFVPTEINGRWCLVYQRIIKRWHLVGLSTEKQQHKVTSSHQWQLYALTFVYLFTIIFSKRSPEMRSMSKICVKLCFSTSPLSRHKIYCSEVRKRITP